MIGKIQIPVAVLGVFEKLGEDGESSAEKRLTGANIGKVLLSQVGKLEPQSRPSWDNRMMEPPPCQVNALGGKERGTG